MNVGYFQHNFYVIVMGLHVVSIFGAVTHGPRNDDSLAAVVHDMTFCFVEPGAPGSPAELNTTLGKLHITKFCCQKSVVNGLNFDSKIVQRRKKKPWRGSTRLMLRLQDFSSSCHAEWRFPRGGSQGTFSLDLTSKSGKAPFVDVSIDIAGSPIIAGGEAFPFPSKTKATTCVTNFKIDRLAFRGPLQWVVNLLFRTVTTGVMRPFLRFIICRGVKKNIPKELNKALRDFRAHFTPLMSQMPRDLDPPAAPVGSGPSIDFRNSAVTKFTQHLLQQGLATGDMQTLIQRTTGGTGNISLVLPEAVTLDHVVVEHPANLSTDILIEGGSVDGLHTIDSVKLAATGPHELAVMFAQKQFDLSLALRTRSFIPHSDKDAVSSRRLTEILFERFSLVLKLSDVNVTVRGALLLDEARTLLLHKGQSWTSTPCAMTMVQTGNVTGMDVQGTVREFQWTSLGKAPSELEAQFDQSMNNMLKYLNDPRMQKTVSRLVRAFAADSMRDMVNSQISDTLSAPGAPCEPKFGVGSIRGFHLLVVCGSICALAGVAFSLCWCMRRSHAEKKKYLCHSTFLFVISSMCLVNGGQIGYPFRAGLRLHNGGEAVDTILYVYVMDLSDVITWIPAGVALTVFTVVIFGSARFLAIIVATLTHFGRRSADCVKWFSAVGAWGLSVPFIMAGTQIASFYAKIIKFGDSYADLGIQINPSLYWMLLGYLLLDMATVCVYSHCCKASAQAVVKRCQSGRTPVPQAYVPRRISLVALALAILALLIAPWMTLWSHTYEGFAGRVAHYNDGWTRSISLLSIICETWQYLLNPFEVVGFGAVIMQFVLIVHVIVAPVVHAAIAFYVGVSLRRQRSGAKPEFGASDCFSFLSVLSDEQLDTAPPKLSWGRIREIVLGYLFMVTRMWAGADAFAAYMIIYVPQLNNQMIMMAEMSCSELAPTLKTLGEAGYDDKCFALTSKFEIGLPMLLIAGVVARLCAELCAHAPLRAQRYAQAMGSQSSPSKAAIAISLAEQRA